MLHRLSAGVVVVRRSSGDWLFLMLRAYRNWDFPKGLVEPGEDPLQAARREVQEETLIEQLQFNWGEVFLETAPYSHRKVARYYLAETRTAEVTLPVRPELGRPEHNEWRWLSFEQARALCSPRIDPILRWARATVGAATANAV
ncbi:MAG: NUDIX domain-containing protein [Sinobacteraceae bacterium]|nr:NUDIX domain-containing protein [Nevskiaceae bacterium]MBV9914052.1 NUDIX domain-containing protein [Nevskiaceae bacterium]